MEPSGPSGTCGVVGESPTPEFVLRVVKAAGTVWNIGRVVIARDTRTTGEMFVNATEFGLVSVGVNVDDLGVVPIPVAVRYCENQAVPDVVTTASHNPPEFNGVKLVGDDGVELAVEELKRIENHTLVEELDVIEWDTVGSVQSVEITNDDYHEDFLVNVDREKIVAANLTVTFNPGYGAGSLVTPDFPRELGCEVRTVNAQPDGHFSGCQSEPVLENLRDLERLVRATDADVGIAHDGDADRAVFANEHGECISGEASLVALAAVALEPGGATASAVSVSQRLVDVCEEAGADLKLASTGATDLITRVRELWREGRNVPVVGKGNGGMFYPNYRLVYDSTYIVAKLLELVAERSASKLVAPYEDYYNVRINLEYDEEAELTATLNAAANYAESADATPNTTDGYRLDYGDAWVLVRPSGTEPKVCVYAEGRSEECATEPAEDAVNTPRNAAATL